MTWDEPSGNSRTPIGNQRKEETARIRWAVRIKGNSNYMPEVPLP